VGRLSPSFFARDTLAVARDLLGQRLVRIVNGRRLSGRIVEAEAYVGEDDLACHASRGRTRRTEVMYGPPGHAYIYFIYGMYHCLNVVTEAEGFPAAVLVRALEPEEGIADMWAYRGCQDERELTSGPGKLCMALQIDRRLNGIDLCDHGELFLEEGEPIAPHRIATSTRIGIRVPGWAAEAPWRVYVADSPFVSGAPRRATHRAMR